MKRFSALLAILFLCAIAPVNAQDDVVLTVGTEDVTLEEFEYIYKKNNRDKAITKDSLDNYIDLFINFKLKVLEAKSMGLDTNKAFIKELKGYRKQLSRPYLTDSDMLDEMIQESYDRMTEEVRAKHILVKCEENAKASDTLKAYRKIMKLRERIVNGEDFETVAKSKGGSEDPSVKQNGGDLGYFSAFKMVYPFECGAYETAVGEVSQPVRTKYGYHLIYVTDKREALGEIKVAHIMIRAKHDTLREAARMKAMDIHSQLNSGADFAEMAKKHSDDKNSSKSGGELAWFGSGKMIPAFEKAAFELKKNGDISKPVETPQGFFIIKRLDYKPVPEFDQVKKELKTKISRDQRSEVTKDSFIAKTKQAYGFALNAEVVESLRSLVDTSIYMGQLNYTDPNQEGALAELEFCSIADVSIPTREFIDELGRLKIRYRTDDVMTIFDRQVKKFTDKVVLDYEDSKLEDKYDDFRLLMNEYRDGMLLFELTDEKVWSKAVKDTTGLEAYYEANKSSYMWGERVKGTIYTCDNKKVAKKARKGVKKGLSDVELESKFNQESSLIFQHKTDTFEKGSADELDLIDWSVGVSKVYEKKNGQFIFVEVDEILPETQKAFDETRGPVTADYQKHLEDLWVKELRGKYAFKLNKDVLYSIADK